MATLVLTAVGTAIGGPIGGAIGAILGQQADSALFAPNARQGPRLRELAVQTSSYGTQIPAIFGRMRVAGTVFWSTDLIERRVKSGGGKGRPSIANYSYSVSMAVSLSSRPILRVGRIWADGNLLRGSAGDLKVDTQLRIYDGHGDQLPDPLIASAEIAGRCPAHRGLAYAVFEDLQLADYGNRIPSLSFEIFERDGSVSISAIVAASTAGKVRGNSQQSLLGYALYGASAKDALSPLFDALPIELVPQGSALSLEDAASAAGAVTPITAVTSDGRESFELPQKQRDASKEPHRISLKYYDVDRDFQASVQQSERSPVSRNIVDLELPAVLAAGDAKRVIEHCHFAFHRDSRVWTGDVAFGPDPIVPSRQIVDADGKPWQVTECEYRLGSTRIKARPPVTPPAQSEEAAAPGRAQRSPDLVAGQTRMMLVDLPAVGEADTGRVRVGVFAAGTASGWRRAALSLWQRDDLVDLGPTAAPAVLGATIDLLPAHNALLIDQGAGVRVRLLHEAMRMVERDASPLDDDAPLVAIGGELIRVGKCEALGNNIYSLSRLQRGCFANRAFAEFHPVDTQVVIVDPGTVRLLDEYDFSVGTTVSVEALGLGDTTPAVATGSVKGRAIVPLPPVHGKLQQLADGSLQATWIRCSRLDLGWRDGVDQAMVEQEESYLVDLLADGALISQWTVPVNQIALSADTMTAFAIQPEATLSLQVAQIGRFAQSAPAPLHIQL
jgi:hypothetical protein